jgi:hypothetical protein
MSRITLILIAMLFCAPTQAQDCEIPAGFTNVVYVVESDTLQVTLATEKQVYAPADTVRLWLILKNIGNTGIPEMFSCNPFASARVYEAGCDTVDESGCDAVWSHFPFCYFDVDGEPGLAPGDCLGIYHEWRISESGDVADGEYNVIGAFLYVCIACTPQTSHYIPAVGARVTIEIDSSGVPVTPASWGRLKALYR